MFMRNTNAMQRLTLKVCYKTKRDTKALVFLQPHLDLLRVSNWSQCKAAQARRGKKHASTSVKHVFIMVTLWSVPLFCMVGLSITMR